MTETNYALCPCGRPLVVTVPGFARCPSIGPQEATADSDAKWIPYLAAWVCLEGWRKYRRALDMGHKAPPISPQAMDDTRLERASFRPPHLTEYLRRGIDD